MRTDNDFAEVSSLQLDPIHWHFGIGLSLQQRVRGRASLIRSLISVVNLFNPLPVEGEDVGNLDTADALQRIRLGGGVIAR